MINAQEISNQLYTSISKIVRKHGSTVDVSVIINEKNILIKNMKYIF